MSPTGSRKTSTESSPSHFSNPYALGSPPRISTSPQVASKAYIDHYHTAFNHQRRAHESERVMWNIERTGLVEKIAALEALLRQQRVPSSGRRSASAKLPTSSSGPPKVGSFPGPIEARNAIEGSGNEFWRGAPGKHEPQPARTLLESATYLQTNADRIPSIAENLPPSKLGRSLSESLKQSARGIGRPDTQKHYDGILFKSTSIPSAHPSGLKTTKSGPSSGSLSSSRDSPGHLQLSIVHEVPDIAASTPDNLTKHAGHTPVARTIPGLDGTTSAIENDLLTPTMEQERPPIEPRTSTAKIPSERSDSYFPAPADDFDHGDGCQDTGTSSQGQQDPELQGQLGLKNDLSSDNSFLSELDSKLANAAQSSSLPASANAPANSKGGVEDVEGFDQPEPEPKLIIKRSMNFGSQMGAGFGPQP